jgi:hypothetical protein
MKAALVLIEHVGRAGSAQEEDEACEDILQRNTVLITPLAVLESLLPITTFEALGNHHKTRFLSLLYRAFLLITILPISVRLSISL